MKKIRLTESDLKKLVYESTVKTIRLIKESGEERQLPDHWEHIPRHFARTKTDEYGIRQWPTWYDRDFQEPDGNYGEETDASIRAEVEDAYSMLPNYYTKALGIIRWGQKKNVSPQYVERAFYNNAPERYSLAFTYISKKAKRDGVPAQEVAINISKEPKEKVIEDMLNVLRPELENTYKKWYNKYEDDYQAAMEHRGNIEQAMNPLIEKYANADPSTMTYVEICKALDSLKNAYLVNPDSRWWDQRYEGIETYGVAEYYKGNPILETYKKLQEEKRRRRASVKFYNIGYINKFSYNPSQEEIDEWEELKALLKKYKEINGGSSDNHRGDNAQWGDIVDQNGELVATYNYKVDSSG